MTVWILVFIVSGFDGYPGNSPLSTGSVTFHSQASCENAVAKFKRIGRAYCFEDTTSQPEAK